ncbi:ADP-ribosylglycohydrolase family protein [Gryllotalpicola sp.]|uniref:ADP-ribosylglycohydrolase family protein n=1 Tax=Gryllotalpicola sp. TaxID=1932787 RepID=UPI00261B3BB8|nr:ADP-ribosylglycohydrolase family protein [Gryllotalpicola sp.]
MTALSRARGALWSLALGDALGMPTQNLPRAFVRARYGLLGGFQPGPAENEISAGLPAGRVTDDTDQALILGRLLVAGGGHVAPRAFADALLDWERRMREAGSHDLLGPSTSRALALAAEGVPPDQTGRHGTTNGAAMRIAPLGIAVPAEPVGALVDAVEESTIVTHHTGLAIAGAAAVAAAVSAGVSGAGPAAARAVAVEAARLGQSRGEWAAGPSVAARIAWAVDLVAGCDPAEALERIDDLVGTSVATQESVPAAFAVAALFPADPWNATRHAASLGGDSDTIAAIAGAIAGAAAGVEAIPVAALAELAAANPGLGVDALAGELLALREAAAEAAR